MINNSEIHFSQLPTVDAPRSVFDLSHEYKTTFNFGSLIPLGEPLEILPGDTFNVSTSILARFSSALKTPVMDNAYIDLFGFFVPTRLTWEHWEEFNGESDDPWVQTTARSIPTCSAPSSTGWTIHSVASYFGYPIGKTGYSVNRLPFNGYCKIWNDWFRDENVQYCTGIDISDSNLTGSNGTDITTDPQKGGTCLPVNRFHDYFSSCLPTAQKGPAVTIPLGQRAEVYNNEAAGYTRFVQDNGTGNGIGNLELYPAAITMGTTGNASFFNGNGTGNGYGDVVGYTTVRIPRKSDYLDSTLYTDLSTATSATINSLREAFALQKMYETRALYGSRYTEMIRGFFGIVSPDARLQRSEFLFSRRVPITIHPVANTTGDYSAGATKNANVGDLAAFGIAGDSKDSFIHSFTEHGFLYLLACARTNRSYQQGLTRLAIKRDVEDFYLPVFANLGNMPVYNKQLFITGTAATDNAVFGYQEAWAEYRYCPSRVTGQFSSDATGSLDYYHYADDYSATPYLSDSWMREGTAQVDRTLQVTSAVSDQIIFDSYFTIKATREMPMYSVPGLRA